MNDGAAVSSASFPDKAGFSLDYLLLICATNTWKNMQFQISIDYIIDNFLHHHSQSQNSVDFCEDVIRKWETDNKSSSIDKKHKSCMLKKLVRACG